VLTQCTACATNTPARPSKVVSSGAQLAQVRIYYTENKDRSDDVFPSVVDPDPGARKKAFVTSVAMFYELLLFTTYMKYIFFV
jgi:hypothetical protein